MRNSKRVHIMIYGWWWWWLRIIRGNKQWIIDNHEWNSKTEVKQRMEKGTVSSNWSMKAKSGDGIDDEKCGGVGREKNWSGREGSWKESGNVGGERGYLQIATEKERVCVSLRLNTGETVIDREKEKKVYSGAGPTLFQLLLLFILKKRC